jgi:hypothetical protein
MTATTAVLPAAPPDALMPQRDDGPLARALGRLVPASAYAVPLLVAGLVPVFATIALDGAGAPRGLVAVELAWLVLCGGASAGAPARGRLRWTAPVMIRLGEYAGLIWIAALGGAPAAAFALLCAIGFRLYEAILRRGTPRPAWLDALALGWDGRLILGFLLLVAGALPTGWFVWAALFAALHVAEAAAVWVRGGPGQTEDEDDEEALQ